MDIELRKIKIKDLCSGYFDNFTNGVFGYGGNLNIRPAYQREFVYKDEARNKVIETVFKGFPLNVMYWIDMGGGKYEILDGQQRTISLCQYFINQCSINEKQYSNLTSDKKDLFDNYELMIYVCSGTESEKLDWFKTINIAGEKLTDQELRNAVYTGAWLSSAKKYFSHSKCNAQQNAGMYLSGSAIRQDYLEKVLQWISHQESDPHKPNIENYMATHQHDKDAKPLHEYFETVMKWVKHVFPVYRKEMKGIEWGILYNLYGHKQFNATDTKK